jgi:hypothetical protein
VADIDTQLTAVAERHRKAVAENLPVLAQLLILDADALLDQRLARPLDTRAPTR